MSDFIELYKILEIPTWDIVKYFLTHFGTALILVTSFIAFICCNFLFTLYHLYMKKDEENSSRLLNVFYGHYAMTLQLSSFFILIAVVFESFNEPIVVAEENGDNFACVVNRFRLLLVCMMLVEQIEVTAATLLRHWKPDVYLKISLKWFPKLGMVFLLFVSFIIFMAYISVFDSNVMCSCMSAKRRMAKMSSVLLVSL